MDHSFVPQGVRNMLNRFGGSPSSAAAEDGLRQNTYFELSRSALYSFLFVLPLFLLYEGLILLVNLDEGPDVGLGVEVMFKRIILRLGTAPMLGLSVVVAVIGIVIFFMSRRKGQPLVGRYFTRMMIESLIYAVVMGLLVGTIVGSVFGFWSVELAQIGGKSSLSIAEMLTLSIGAGLYEEFFFRLLLVGGLFAVARLFTSAEQHVRTYIIVAVVAALIFSGVHYIGSLGDAFELPSFTFRFLLGLVLNVLFLARGFGIAVWTHSIYDILVTLLVGMG